MLLQAVATRVEDGQKKGEGTVANGETTVEKRIENCTVNSCHDFHLSARKLRINRRRRGRWSISRLFRSTRFTNPMKTGV